MSTKKRFWVSWYTDEMGTWELHFPWWTSGYSDTFYIICAAVVAENEDQVREIIYSCYDKRPDNLEFSFINERPDDWSPFNDRFQAKDWMTECWDKVISE